MNARISKLSKWSMLLGNLFEYYDTALFGLLSPFLAPLFFPNNDPLTALILTYCIIPLGMISRPLGSLLFGYIGDTKGRKEALILSLSGMALMTGLMGFLPTFEQVGILAPILLSLGRLMQNFFAAGESMGGAIYLIENSTESKKNIMSGWFGSSTIAGILLASAGVSTLCGFNIIQDCWRILYFCGSITIIFAIILRLYHRPTLNSSTPAIAISSKKSFTFLLQTCWSMKKELTAIAVAAGFSSACYTLSLVLMNGFVPLISSISKEEMMHLNTFLLIIDFLLLPLFGLLANRFSREKMMSLAGIIALISGFPLFWFLDGASLVGIIFIRLALVIIGVCFSAPFHAWAQSLVPPEYRYTVISFAYALGSQIFGGPTASLSLWLFQKTHSIVSVGWYWMILGGLACYFVAKQKVEVQANNDAIEIT